jgi:hypothetical protein
MPNNDMGKPQNITNETFEAAATAMGQSTNGGQEKRTRNSWRKFSLPRKSPKTRTGNPDPEG